MLLSGFENFVVLCRRDRLLKFKGLYAIDADDELTGGVRAHRVHGKGPAVIDPSRMVARMYKYDSGARVFKEFTHENPLGTGTVCTTHAVVLRPRFYKSALKYDQRQLL